MKRMKTFFLYALIIVGFYLFSLFVENGFIKNMYKPLNLSIGENLINQDQDIILKNVDGRASSVNGTISFDYINTTGNYIDEAYLKIDLYNKQNQLSGEEYVKIQNLAPGQSKKIMVKFKAHNINRFEVSLLKEMPDYANIINILGWEIDLSNVFGHDLTNFNIMGKSLKDIFSTSNIKEKGSNIMEFIRVHLVAIPWWGYAIGGGIVAWYLPAFYLFLLP